MFQRGDTPLETTERKFFIMRSLKRTLSLLLTAALLLGLVILPAAAEEEDELPTLTKLEIYWVSPRGEKTIIPTGEAPTFSITLNQATSHLSLSRYTDGDVGSILHDDQVAWSISPSTDAIDMGSNDCFIDYTIEAGDYVFTATPIEGKCLGDPISFTLSITTAEPVFTNLFWYGLGDSEIRGYFLQVPDQIDDIVAYDQFNDRMYDYPLDNLTISSSTCADGEVVLRKLTEEEKRRFSYPVEWGLVYSRMAQGGTLTLSCDGVSNEVTLERNPKPYEIEITGPDEITTPAAGEPDRTYSYSARAISDQYGDPIEYTGPFEWDLGWYEGDDFSVDENGTVTVKSGVNDTFGRWDDDNLRTVTAKSLDGGSGKKTVALKHDTARVASLFMFSNDLDVHEEYDEDDNLLRFTVARPSEVTFECDVYDQYDCWMEEETVTWSCDNTSPAVTFDPATGVLTVSTETPDNTTFNLTATNGDVSLTFPVEIETLNVNWPKGDYSDDIPYYGTPDSSAISFPETGTAVAGTVQLEGTFTLSDPDSIHETGNHNATLVFTVTTPGKYQGATATKNYNVTIRPKPVTVTVEDKIRPYGEKNPALTFSVPEGALVGNDTVEDLYVTLSCEADETTLPGTVAITGDYDWCDNYDVTVVPGTLTITKADIPGLTLSDLTVPFGAAVSPAAKVENESKYGELTYTYTYTDAAGEAVTKPVNAGRYTMTVTAENSLYKATASATLTITAVDLSAAMLTLPENFSAVYDKTAHAPRITVTLDGAALTEGRDYTVAYSDNTNAGQATVTVTGIGGYSGTVTTNFTIEKASLANFKPLISGKAEAGSVLSATLPGVDPGEVNFFWVVGDTASTAPALSYTVAKNDSNQTISVKAAAVENGNYDGPAAPSEVRTVAKVTLSGNAMLTERNGENGTQGLYEVGDTIQVNGYLEPSASRMGSTWQWYRNGAAIDGACGTLNGYDTTPMAYTITADDVDSTLKLVWTGNENFLGTVEQSVTVGKTVLTGQAKLLVNGQEPTASRTAVVGDVLTLSTDAPAGSYDILWFDWDSPLAHTGDSYTVTTADLGRTIHVQLAGKGIYTGSIRGDFITVDPLAPAAPVLRATAGNGNVTLSWAAPAANGSPITGYTLTMDGGTTVDLAPSVTSYTFEKLENGVEYSFTLTATNAAGSTTSDAVTAAPKAGGTSNGSASGGGASGGGASSDKTENAPVQTEHPDGSVTTTITAPDGTVTSTTTTPDGSETVTTLAPDGSSAAALTRSDGLRAAWTTTAAGASSLSVTLPTEGETTRLVLPLADLTPTTVAVWVREDGTEEILKTSAVTEDGLALALKESGQLKLVDNAKSFSDTADHWASESVDFVTSHELFQGVGADTFAPDLTMTRGMLVTVLSRLEGALRTAEPIPFSDVAEDTWYTDAVAWATENGIVTGVAQGVFAPEVDITREQLATMLYRYAQTLGYGAGEEDTLQTCPDGDSIHLWALEAMLWMTQTGLLTGKEGGRMDPQATATRAEVAAVLTRFVTLLTQ